MPHPITAALDGLVLCALEYRKRILQMIEVLGPSFSFSKKEIAAWPPRNSSGSEDDHYNLCLRLNTEKEATILGIGRAYTWRRSEFKFEIVMMYSGSASPVVWTAYAWFDGYAWFDSEEEILGWPKVVQPFNLSKDPEHPTQLTYEEAERLFSALIVHQKKLMDEGKY